MDRRSASDTAIFEITDASTCAFKGFRQLAQPEPITSQLFEALAEDEHLRRGVRPNRVQNGGDRAIRTVVVDDDQVRRRRVDQLGEVDRGGDALDREVVSSRTQCFAERADEMTTDALVTLEYEDADISARRRALRRAGRRCRQPSSDARIRAVPRRCRSDRPCRLSARRRPPHANPYAPEALRVTR